MKPKENPRSNIILLSSGTLTEGFDWIVFLSSLPYLTQAITGLVISNGLLIFALGFLARPFGAAYLGYYARQ